MNLQIRQGIKERCEYLRVLLADDDNYLVSKLALNNNFVLSRGVFAYC